MKYRLNKQYDKFLHEIQKIKMKELWNNKEDEVWDTDRLLKPIL